MQTKKELLGQMKDWDLFEERHLYKQLSALGQDFHYAAKMYGKIIMYEFKIYYATTKP